MNLRRKKITLNTAVKITVDPKWIKHGKSFTLGIPLAFTAGRRFNEFEHERKMARNSPCVRHCACVDFATSPRFLYRCLRAVFGVHIIQSTRGENWQAITGRSKSPGKR